MKMRHKQAYPTKRTNRPMKFKAYSPSAMFNAYKLVKENGIAVKTAARQYGVPHNTLRDRVKGRIDPECLVPGPNPLFSQEEEAKLVQHIKTMAELGYGFTITEVVNKASDYAVFLKKRAHDKPLSVKWFQGFRNRWPELRVGKPRALSKCRAESTSKEVVEKYFTNLRNVMENNNLIDKPGCIYNIDEKGIQTEHAPPYVVSGKKSVPAITSSRSSITTIIGGGNALGTQIPPFFVFKGQRINDELLQGASHGSTGTMSKSGWSNSLIFQEYLENHFIKYVQREDSSQPIIIIFDGHKSHINVPVLDWAKKNNVILFVLPAHTSHVLQPLDVGCFGPLQKIYNNACHKFLRERPSSKITRYDVSALALNSYVKAFSTSNLRAAFQKTGIFPLNENSINTDNFKPSEPYNSSIKEKTPPNQQDVDFQPDLDAYFKQAENSIEQKKKFHQVSDSITVSKIASGQEITDVDISEQIKAKVATSSSQKQASKKRSSNSTQANAPKKPKNPLKCPTKSKKSTNPEPVPGPSHINIIDTDTDSDITDDDMPEKDKCCVCKLFQPIQLKEAVSLVFTKWAKCETPGCEHRTHLIYCCKQRVIRRNDTFICPCHINSQSEE